MFGIFYAVKKISIFKSNTNKPKMEVYKLKGTDDTPEVVLDAEKQIMLIQGKSFPADVTELYDPILDWLREYADNPNKKTEITLKLDYFNTASSKLLLDILYVFEDIYGDGNEVLVKWFFPEDDEDMEETGEEYAEIVDVPFEHIGFETIYED